MSDNNGWPDPARPGVPPHPKAAMRHWILIWGIETICFWSATKTIWYTENGKKISVPEMAGGEYKYLGPCLTPDEVDARITEARRAAPEGHVVVPRVATEKMCRAAESVWRTGGWRELWSAMVKAALGEKE